MSRPPLTLGFLTGVERGRVKLRCRPCHRDAYFTHTDLAAFFGEHVTFEALKARAYCKRCGRKVDDDLVAFQLDQAPPSREVALRTMWGGFGGHLQLAELEAQKAAEVKP